MLCIKLRFYKHNSPRRLSKCLTGGEVSWCPWETIRMISCSLWFEMYLSTMVIDAHLQMHTLGQMVSVSAFLGLTSIFLGLTGLGIATTRQNAAVSYWFLNIKVILRFHTSARLKYLRRWLPLIVNCIFSLVLIFYDFINNL